jgi:N-acetylglucosamine-6-sulfatase
MKARQRSFLAAVCAFLSVQAAQERPNLLVIMTDDLRIGMLSSDGHPYMETPNLDRFVQEGVRFNNAYALSPVCGPSRASIFTGQYSSMHMRRDNFYYPDSYKSYLPQQFKDAGYHTALIGKYYEGEVFEPTARNAWDRWFTMGGPSPDKPREPGMSQMDWRNKWLYYDQMYDVDGRYQQVMGHQTDVLFDEAARFAVGSAEPFCVFLSPFAPHRPLNMSERNKGRYRGKGLPPAANQELDKGFFSQPGKLEMVVELYEQYCEMIADLDDGMGRLFQTLEKSGQLDNTLIIFTSDNGLMYGEHGFAWKRHPWEESAKVPFFVRYPKLAKPGTSSDALVCLADIFFTCADLGSVELPEIDGQQGCSLLPLLNGEKEQVRDELIFIQYEMPDRANPWLPELMLHASIVRPDGWKLTAYNEPPDQRPGIGLRQMFNLHRDGLEMTNCAQNPEYQSVFTELKTELTSKLDQIRADSSWLK